MKSENCKQNMTESRTRMELVLEIDDEAKLLGLPNSVLHDIEFLHKLIESNCPKSLDSLLTNVPEVDPNEVPAGCPYTPFGVTIKEGRVECAKVFLKHANRLDINLGGPPMTFDCEALVPIIAAVVMDHLHDTHFVRLLVDHRPPIDLNEKQATIHVSDKQMFTGATALVFSIVFQRIDLVELLLSTGDRVNVDAVDARGRTALHYAVLYCELIEYVKLLLDAGADRSLRDNNGDTPAGIAGRLNLKEIHVLIEEYKYKSRSDVSTETSVKAEKTVENPTESTDVSKIQAKFGGLFDESEVEMQTAPMETSTKETPLKEKKGKERSTVGRACDNCHFTTEPIDIVLQPCNHLSICSSCSEKAKKENNFVCPRCQMKVVSFYQILL